MKGDGKIPLWLAKFVLSRYDRAIVFILTVLITLFFLWKFVLPKLTACETTVSKLSNEFNAFVKVQEVKHSDLEKTDERIEKYFQEILRRLPKNR